MKTDLMLARAVIFEALGSKFAPDKWIRIQIERAACECHRDVRLYVDNRRMHNAFLSECCIDLAPFSAFSEFYFDGQTYRESGPAKGRVIVRLGDFMYAGERS